MKSKKIFLILTFIFSFIILMVSCTSVHAAANQIQVAAIAIPSDNPENTVKPGDQITIALTFQDSLSNIESVSNLQIKIGANGETKTLTSKSIEAISTNTIEFVYTISENDSGIIDVVSGNITIDEQEYPIPELSNVVTVDNVAPKVVQYSMDNTEPGEYKEGDKINISILFNENVIIQNAPTLSIKFGDGNSKSVTKVSSSSRNSITYEYVITAGDNGELQVLGLTGGNISDEVGNTTTLDVEFEQTSTSITASTSSSTSGSTNNVGNNNTTNNTVKGNSIGNGTTSNKILPFAGNSYFIIIAIILVSIVASISYINYKKYIGIK